MAHTNQSIDQRSINTIRFLSVDAIQKAKSGHPGLPMGTAPMAYVLWSKHLRFNPKNPKWFNRDRFVLSAGHGSMLLYSLLHLTGYDSISIEDIKQFRQWGGRTPGHPENKKTPGVEITTGPLGQGVANAVGMAMAEAHLAARFNKSDCQIVDHHTYTLMGDGCMMEGISSEACSLAGHLGLGKLIALYDDNRITIDGATDLTFTEDVGKRFEAYGWQVLTVADGDTDLDAISAALDTARAQTDKPTLIRIRTTIGFGSPAKAGTSDCHGAPLGPEEVAATRKMLGWDHDPFVVPDDVAAHMSTAVERGARLEPEWDDVFAIYKKKYPTEATAFENLVSGDLPEGWTSELPSLGPNDKKNATRGHSGQCLNALADPIAGLIGGSADLSPSNKTLISDSGDFARGAYHNRNLRFGVREHAMGAICNGLALHGSGLVPYCATFLAFADYMRNAIRMSALCGARVIYIMTHDSIAVGEDGPTHQPVEHVASLRMIPDLVVIRPADGNETSGAYMAAVSDRSRPTLMALSRQGVPNLDGSSAQAVSRGAYVITNCKGQPDLILIGTGAELSLCVEAGKVLNGEGIPTRVVSMPSWELFDEQDEAYRESILPAAVTRRLAVEAGVSFGWRRYTGSFGSMIGVDKFGTSAPGNTCLEKFGFTTDNVLKEARKLLSR